MLGSYPLPQRRQAASSLARAAFAALAGIGLTISPALAQEATPLRLELNRLEPRDNGACRVWLVANNAAEALDPLRLDLVLFGKDAVILRRLAVDVGPLPAARTAVRIFDVAGLRCDEIGQVLLNDVLACGGAEPADRARCVDRIAPGSRAADVAFTK
jgi:hypothetical protein